MLRAAEVKAVSPPGAQIVGPYTPGLVAGKFLYVWDKVPKTARENIRGPRRGRSGQNTFDNVKLIVEAAGLTMEHVVYSQLYVTDRAAYEEALAAWSEYFKGAGPALAVLGVSRIPSDTPVEINAVAVTDLGMKRVVRLPGGRAGAPPDAVVAGDRLFFASCSAIQTQLALDRLGAVLKAAGIGFAHVVFVNPYVTDSLQVGEMNRVYGSTSSSATRRPAQRSASRICRTGPISHSRAWPS